METVNSDEKYRIGLDREHNRFNYIKSVLR